MCNSLVEVPISRFVSLPRLSICPSYGHAIRPATTRASQSDKPFTAFEVPTSTSTSTSAATTVVLGHLIVAMAQSPLDRPPPSAASYAIAAAIISFTTGYFVGKARSIGLFGRSPVDNIATSAGGADSSSSGSDSEGSAQDLGELQTFEGSTEECKLVLVVRTDLGMTKGRSNRVSHMAHVPRVCRVVAWARATSVSSNIILLSILRHALRALFEFLDYHMLTFTQAKWLLSAGMQLLRVTNRSCVQIPATQFSSAGNLKVKRKWHSRSIAKRRCSCFRRRLSVSVSVLRSFMMLAEHKLRADLPLSLV